MINLKKIVRKTKSWFLPSTEKKKDYLDEDGHFSCDCGSFGELQQLTDPNAKDEVFTWYVECKKGCFHTMTYVSPNRAWEVWDGIMEQVKKYK